MTNDFAANKYLDTYPYDRLEWHSLFEQKGHCAATYFFKLCFYYYTHRYIREGRASI